MCIRDRSASAYESGERHISYGQADHRFDAGPEEEASIEESTDLSLIHI